VTFVFKFTHQTKKEAFARLIPNTMYYKDSLLLAQTQSSPTIFH